jgi:hypothetical protein
LPQRSVWTARARSGRGHGAARLLHQTRAGHSQRLGAPVGAAHRLGPDRGGLHRAGPAGRQLVQAQSEQSGVVRGEWRRLPLIRSGPRFGLRPARPARQARRRRGGRGRLPACFGVGIACLLAALAGVLKAGRDAVDGELHERGDAVPIRMARRQRAKPSQDSGPGCATADRCTAAAAGSSAGPPGSVSSSSGGRSPWPAPRSRARIRPGCRPTAASRGVPASAAYRLAIWGSERYRISSALSKALERNGQSR